jgi:hypothetical protein
VTVDNGLRPLFRQHIPDFDWCTIETGMTTQGVPDSNYCGRPLTPRGPGFEGFVEYKATDGYVVDLRPEQIGWICRRVRWGGRVWIAVRRQSTAGPRKGSAVDELWVFPGRLAKEARLGGLRDSAVAASAKVWHGGPARWDWRAVAARLRLRG